MSNPICNTLEFEQLTAPEFDPQKFAENIRAEHTKTIAKELPSDLYESVRQEFSSLGIYNEAAIVLRAIAIMAREYTDRRCATKSDSAMLPSTTTTICFRRQRSATDADCTSRCPASFEAGQGESETALSVHHQATARTGDPLCAAMPNR